MRRIGTGFLVTAFLAVPVFGASFVVPADRDLILKAERIVYGDVLDSSARYNDSGAIETVTRISVRETILGPPESLVEVVTLGGRVGDRSLVIPGSPVFRDGDRVLVLLARNGHGEWTTVDLVLGKFRLARGPHGEELLVRQFDEIAGWDMRGEAHSETFRNSARFLSYVRDVARGGAGVIDYEVEIGEQDQYVLLAPEVENLRSGTDMTPAAGESPNDYTLVDGLGNGYRWNSFGITDQFYFNRNSQPGKVDGGVSDLTAALAAWTNDCDSEINVFYGGVNGAAVGNESFDGVNGVVFDDPFNQISGSYNCQSGGTLGIGGFWTSGPDHVFGGDTMGTIGEGNVTLQDNLDCWSGLNDARFIQLLVHEIGHSLGFRHSDEPSAGQSPNTTAAIMRASLVTNYGDTLQAYDQEAAETVYPGGSCATLAPADFTGDSNSDILLRNQSTGQNAVWSLNGTTYANTFNLPTLPNTSYRMQGTSDIDGDNDPDILWRNYSTGLNAVWVMNNTTYSSAINLPTLPNTDYVIGGSGDFDGNGSEDILWRNQTTGANAIWLMSGASYTGTVNLPTLTNTNYEFAGVADMDGDNDPDIVLRNYSTGQTAIWVMAGTSFSSITNLPTVPNTSLRIGALADYDQDGDIDIVFRNSTTGANAIWVMQGGALSSIVNLPTLSNLDYVIGGPR